MLSLLLLAAAPVAPVDPVISALRIAQSNFLRAEADQFAPQDSVPLQEGQHFVVRFKFAAGDRRGVESGGSTLWTYRDEVLRLWISPSDVSQTVGSKRISVPVISYYVSRRQIGRYAGQNAFGVRANVSQHVTSEFGLAVLDRPKGDLSPYTDQDHIDFMKRHGSTDDQLIGFYDNFVFSIAMTGPEARRLATTATAEIEGIIVPLQGRLTGCSSSFSGAQISNPWELTTYTCWAGARISRVTFYDGTKVLKEWRK